MTRYVNRVMTEISLLYIHTCMSSAGLMIDVLNAIVTEVDLFIYLGQVHAQSGYPCMSECGLIEPGGICSCRNSNIHWSTFALGPV
jgi:hypothetical protein